MGTKNIHCTCGQSMEFAFTKVANSGSKDITYVPMKDKTGKDLVIRLGGGAYVLNREMGRTKKVCITQVTDEELELLHTHPAYLRMKDRGFFVERGEDRPVIDQISGNPQDMEKKDNTSQISDEDHAKGTDPRLDHAGTKAFAGMRNQEKGAEPIRAEIQVDM